MARLVKALDLFCGGGGAALGLVAAGMDVVGIDSARLGRRALRRRAACYPGRYVVGDVLGLPVEGEWDFVWVSPPCQRWSTATAHGGGDPDRHPDLVGPTRELIESMGVPGVIENVRGAPVRADIVLTGPGVGLPYILRRRHFECLGWLPPAIQPEPQRPTRAAWRAGRAVTITTSMCSTSHYYARRRAGKPGRVSVGEAKEVMGIPAHVPMTGREIGEAVPPPMAEWVARAYLDTLHV